MAATPNAMTVMATMVVMTAMAAIINLRIFGLKKLSEMIMSYSKDGLRVSHHEQKYFCSFCNFRTHKKYNLEIHKKNKHRTSQTSSGVLLSGKTIPHDVPHEILHKNVVPIE